MDRYNLSFDRETSGEVVVTQVKRIYEGCKLQTRDVKEKMRGKRRRTLYCIASWIPKRWLFPRRWRSAKEEVVEELCYQMSGSEEM